jgi:hypothetical protein
VVSVDLTPCEYRQINNLIQGLPLVDSPRLWKEMKWVSIHQRFVEDTRDTRETDEVVVTDSANLLRMRCNVFLKALRDNILMSSRHSESFEKKK